MNMDVVVVQKCLAFCQGLVESNIRFTFNLSLAKDAFIFDNKELAKSSCEKKKKSPSQLRREKKRKEERQNKKEDTVKVYETLDESPTFKCDHCKAEFKSEKGLNIHVGKSHKTNSSATPEKERGSSPQKELLLNLTPAKEVREELNNTDLEEYPEKEMVPSTFKCEYCKYPPREFGTEAQLSIHHSKRHSYKQENIGRIHQCPLCHSNSKLTQSVRNNYYIQHDLNTHTKIVHENSTNSIVITWDGFFET